MNINATLIGQSIAFFVFVLCVMKFVWPPLIDSLNARRKKIADGLAAAERGQKAQQQAKAESEAILREARTKVNDVLTQAQKRSNEIIEEAAVSAKEKADHIIASAEAEMAQEVLRIKEELRLQLSTLAVEGASKILQKEVDQKAHAKILDELVQQI